jgi:hypothetical protein
MSTLVRLTLVSGLLLTLTPLGIAPRPGASAGEQPQGEEKGFRPVFNLPKPEAMNWIFLGKGRWGIGPDDTIFASDGKGWMLTEEEYRDFTLRLEYKLSRGGNSGVAVRCRPEGDPAHTGLEIQLTDDGDKRPTKHTTGAIWDVVAASKHAAKPVGQWNDLRITAKGRRLTVELNGVTVQDVDLDHYKDQAHRVNGLTRVSGHIGFQVWAGEVTIRKPLVKRLK